MLSPKFLQRRFLFKYLNLRNYGFLRDFLFTRFQKVLDKPMVVHFELTNNCNLNCAMCERTYVWKRRGKGYMDFELFKKGIDEVAEWGVRWVQLNRFGESTLHPDFVKFARYAKEAGIPDVYLISNATLINEALAKGIIKSGLDRIAFSFEGAKKRTYENVRKGAKYEITKRNIERFLEIRQELGKVKPIVQLNTVLMEETKDEIGDVKRMWEDKVDIINIQNFLKKEGVPDLSMPRQKVSVVGRKVCTSPAKKLIVFWNGDVVPCCLDSFGALKIGNLRKSTLKEIWHNEKINELRQKLLNKNFEGLICEECDMTKEFGNL